MKTQQELQEEVSTDEGLAKACITSCLQSNHANTFPFLEVMKACQEARPYREVEAEVAKLPVMHMTHQNPHVLADLLVKCGALEKIIVEEEPSDEMGDVAQTADEEVVTSSADSAESAANTKSNVAPADEAGQNDESASPSAMEPSAADALPEPAENPEDPEDLEDQPIDYLLVITAAGREVLDDFDPAKRIARLIDEEDDIYTELFEKVIAFCDTGKTVKSDDIEDALTGHPAMKSPKPIFAGYFISRLETNGAITWEDNSWKTTDAGRAWLASLQ